MYLGNSCPLCLYRDLDVCLREADGLRKTKKTNMSLAVFYVATEVLRISLQKAAIRVTDDLI